jgi:tetratricopeptide (TPR) repeat protein
MDACIICLESDPPPVRMGCACRGSVGNAHVACLAEAAAWSKNEVGWFKCQTCKHVYTGAVGIALADIRWSRAQDGGRDAAWFNAATNRAISLVDRGAYAESEALWREIVRADREELGDEHPRTMQSMTGLGKTLALQGKHAEAKLIDSELIRAHTATLGPDHRTTREAVCRAKKDAWHALADQAKKEPTATKKAALRDECLRLAREVLAEFSQIFGEDHAITLTATADVASAMANGGNAEEAVPILRRVLAAQTRACGEGHRSTFDTSAHLASALSAIGKFDEAESILVRTVEASTRVLGHGHPRGVVYTKWLRDVRMERLADAHNRAVDMTESGNAAQAVPIFREVIAAQTLAFGAERNSPTLIDTYACLASALAYSGQFKEAKRILVRSVDVSTRAFGPDDPYSARRISSTFANGTAEPRSPRSPRSAAVVGANGHGAKIIMGGFEFEFDK